MDDDDDYDFDDDVNEGDDPALNQAFLNYQRTLNMEKLMASYVERHEELSAIHKTLQEQIGFFTQAVQASQQVRPKLQLIKDGKQELSVHMAILANLHQQLEKSLEAMTHAQKRANKYRNNLISHEFRMHHIKETLRYEESRKRAVFQINEMLQNQLRAVESGSAGTREIMFTRKQELLGELEDIRFKADNLMSYLEARGLEIVQGNAKTVKDVTRLDMEYLAINGMLDEVAGEEAELRKEIQDLQNEIDGVRKAIVELRAMAAA